MGRLTKTLAVRFAAVLSGALFLSSGCSAIFGKSEVTGFGPKTPFVIGSTTVKVTPTFLPNSIAPMKQDGAGLKLSLLGQAYNEAGSMVSLSADDAHSVGWFCTFTYNLNGASHTTDEQQCGSGLGFELSLDDHIQQNRLRVSDLLDVTVVARFNSTELYRFERKIFLNSRLSKLQSCFTGSDVEAAKVALAKRYADAAKTYLGTTDLFSNPSISREGPLVKVTFNTGNNVTALSTLHELVAVDGYLVMLRSYVKTSEAEVCRNRGFHLKTQSTGPHVTALVFDYAGRNVAFYDNGAGNLSVKRVNAVPGVAAISFVTSAVQDSMPVDNARFGDLGNSEVSEWLSERRGPHMIVGLDATKARSLLGR